MDDGAFDRLARIVGHVAPRRALLTLAAGLSQALLVEEIAWGKKGRKKKNKKKRTKKKKNKNRNQSQSCVRTNSASGAAYSIQSRFQGKTLTLAQSEQAFDEGGATSGRIGLTLGGAPIVTVDTAVNAGRTTVNVTYGTAVSGIRRASFTNDGAVITGVVDGRAILPLPAGANPARAQFADGGAPPVVRIDPDLEKASDLLFRKASTEARLCSGVRSRKNSQDHSHDGGRHPKRAGGERSRAGREREIHDEDIDPTIQPGCLGLQALCQTSWIGCQAGVAAGCLLSVFAYGVCFAVGSFTCFAAQEGCRRLARHNPPCCPVRCGGDAVLELWGDDPSCCVNSETCLDPNDNRKGCCAEGFRACHGRSCCADDQDCENDGLCCAHGYSSCGGACCPDGSCLEGSCCAPPSGVACGGTCCPPFSRSCCNGTCCDGDCVNNRICCRTPDETCGNNCCAPGKCCNGVCCADNETCENNVCRQICSPTIHETCPNLPGYAKCCPKGTICCSSGECCPNFAPVCCGDGCCTIGQECCPDNICRSTCIR